ncbi:MAG TPA: hypothetical protein VL728_18775 [Cyclobacteriaceae bacterium]|nr:hypothetical protein [Cyclobacteriaceae bacterium]
MMKIALKIFLLFLLTDTVAQYNTSELTRKFSEYSAQWPNRKIHLIFNQDKFSPGDTVYFKGYFLSEDLSGVAGNQVIDLHLVNSSGNSVLHLKFSTTDGVGKNQLVIPPSLPQGFYVVTAYSSWMLNFDPSFFFKKRIAVVDKNGLTLQSDQKIRAAVEGGRLINGLKNKVIIHADANSVVQIIDSSGANVGHTLTDSTGIGIIHLLPSESNSYFAQRIGDDNKANLPAVQRDGLGISVSRSANGSTKFNLTPTATVRGKELSAIATSRGKVFYHHSFSAESGGIELLIPRENIPEGVARLSILDRNGELLANREFYSEGTVRANVQVNVEKKYFHPRERVSFEISLADEKGQPVEGEFSISAISRDLQVLGIQNSLADELLVQSCLKEPYTIDRHDSTWIFKLNDVLIFNTEEIPWNQILMGKVPKPAHTLSNFIQMKGKVSLLDSSVKKLPDGMDILFYLQRTGIRYQTTVDRGQVWLAVPALTGEDEMLYLGEDRYYVNEQPHGEEVPGLKIDWEKTTPKFQAAPLFKETEKPDPYASFAAKNKLINKSYGFYLAKASPPPRTITSNELVSGDVNINVQEYTLFPTMADLIKEVIQFLQHRRIGERDRVLASLTEDMSLQSTGDPLYIIDGVATKNTSFFLSLRPSELLSVKVVISAKKLKPLGMLGKNGIVMVTTKKGNAREPLDNSKLVQGLNSVVDFTTHSYADNSSAHLPDFRSTVLWEPSLKTSKDGKAKIDFYASDNLGGLNVRIDGITAQGVPFSREVTLHVVNEFKK